MVRVSDAEMELDTSTSSGAAHATALDADPTGQPRALWAQLRAAG